MRDYRLGLRLRTHFIISINQQTITTVHHLSHTMSSKITFIKKISFYSVKTSFYSKHNTKVFKGHLHFGIVIVTLL